MSNKTQTKPKDSNAVINTGGGAYIGGNVSTSGDFVGRDKIVTGSGNVITSPIVTQNSLRRALETSADRATLIGLFKAWLQDFHNFLPYLLLDDDSRDAIEHDMELVEIQFSKPKINFRIIKARLMSTQEIIESSSIEKALIEKAGNMLQEAVEASKVLVKDE